MNIKRILVRIISLSAIVAVLAGCETLNTKYKGEDAGTVALSLTTSRDSQSIAHYALLIRSRSDPDKTTRLVISLSGIFNTEYQLSRGIREESEFPPRDHNHFVGNPGKNYFERDHSEDVGQMFLLNLKAGDYEVYAFEASQLVHALGPPLGSPRYRRISNEKPFSIPFSVKENEAIYIGSYRLNFFTENNQAKGFFSMAPGILPSTLLVSDYFERDINVVKTRFQKENISAKNMVPTEEKTGSDFIRFVKKE